MIQRKLGGLQITRDRKELVTSYELAAFLSVLR